MTDIPPADSQPSPVSASDTERKPQLPTPQRCLVGSAIAAVLAYGMYLMTTNIALSFATHKIQSTSLVVQRISSAVRTLVVGMTTLGMGVFGLAAIGLLLLAIQILLQRRNPSSSAP